MTPAPAPAPGTLDVMALWAAVCRWFVRRPGPTARCHPLNVRTLLMTGGIVALRDSPQRNADMRSFIAGWALVLTILGLVGILALTVFGVAKS